MRRLGPRSWSLQCEKMAKRSVTIGCLGSVLAELSFA